MKKIREIARSIWEYFTNPFPLETPNFRRFTLLFNEGGVEMLDALTTKMGAKDRSKCLEHSLTIAQWCIDRESEGWTIATVDRKAGKTGQLVSFTLRNNPDHPKSEAIKTTLFLAFSKKDDKPAPSE